ncbi:GvpL/GvpF family gas vesicle protein [Nonomuraea lactucae]|uniref:GvpL/GvpF family gas vesicle protein n=1 Tax=Nonomuraea lactucae TaxID=2249762 RepID=UPI000DE3B33F|nr:GvpL/GvpF family gas vesicle protein [Nonomuraea lactucae]
MTGDTGTYLYAVARDVGAAMPEGLAGVAGSPVRVITAAGLAAYVSTVPLDRFGEEPLRRSMEDLDWLDATARAHHHVVEAVARGAPTVPVRLVTVYSADAQVRSLLDERRDDFDQALSRVAGREEWGVKVYAGPAEQGVAEGAGQGGEAAASPGTAYLKRRQASMRTREEAWRLATARAEHVHDVLRSIAVASMRHRAQDPQLSGREDWMVLNGAYLVDRDRAPEFARALEELRAQGGEVELTGPWAPYSFAVLDEGGAP